MLQIYIFVNVYYGYVFIVMIILWKIKHKKIRKIEWIILLNIH